MSSSSSSTNIHHITAVDWQKRGKNCEVCIKKNLINPINIYCKTCDKYFCHCCLICHQEFTNGHITTQHFAICEIAMERQRTQEEKEGSQRKRPGLEPSNCTEVESTFESKKKCMDQNTIDAVSLDEVDLEKNKKPLENATDCCGQQSISAEINKKQNLPTPILEETKQWSLSEVTSDTYITGITTTDQGDLFMCDAGNLKIFGYNLEGLLLCQCQIPHAPIDICSISSTKLATVSLVKQAIYFLEWNPGCKTLTLTATIRTSNKNYCSICKGGESFLLACDCFTNIDILNFKGEHLSSVFTGRYLPSISTYIHRICPGQTTCRFWMLDYNSQVISDCTLNGLRLGSRCLESQNVNRTDDIIMDRSGFVYGCTVDRVYYCVPNEKSIKSLISFESRLLTDARMCWTPLQTHLIICLETSENYMIKIFKRS